MKPIKCLIALFTIASLGCAYTLVREKEASLPLEVRSIAVPLAKNLTIEAGLEDEFTLELIKTLRADGRVKILSPEAADAELRCTLIELHLAPQAYTRESRIAVERATLEAECALILADAETVAWKTGRIRANEEYPVGNNNLMNEDAKTAAVRLLCQDLAESVRTLLLDSF